MGFWPTLDYTPRKIVAKYSEWLNRRVQSQGDSGGVIQLVFRATTLRRSSIFPTMGGLSKPGQLTMFLFQSQWDWTVFFYFHIQTIRKKWSRSPNKLGFHASEWNLNLVLFASKSSPIPFWNQPIIDFQFIFIFSFSGSESSAGLLMSFQSQIKNEKIWVASLVFPTAGGASASSGPVPFSTLGTGSFSGSSGRSACGRRFTRFRVFSCCC